MVSAPQHEGGGRGWQPAGNGVDLISLWGYWTFWLELLYDSLAREMDSL
jgi:hypothetical protein